jgi:hypothetical protein
MTPRRRIPYATAGLIDEATMSASDTIHMLMPLVRLKATPEQIISLPAQAIINLHTIIDTLKEVRSLCSPAPDHGAKGGNIDRMHKNDHAAKSQQAA